jgi:hypothetical protein
VDSGGSRDVRGLRNPTQEDDFLWLSVLGHHQRIDAIKASAHHIRYSSKNVNQDRQNGKSLLYVSDADQALVSIRLTRMTLFSCYKVIHRYNDFFT